ncbi:hypothetical protein LTR84_010556 [Exophiala bonariae]|uniref:NADP-dependent oxidoreductase domain-containing protein n=1 Tax=Exophiala bonariae TaxID=1690606 RepID=A0AAV9MSS0_9EURO|nr:hypothetical protein LTR84_010556 [Exophiala bonariae]
MSTPQESLLFRHRLLSPTAGVKVSPLCLGAMTFGNKQSERYGEITKQEATEILDTFFEHGGNFIDTANVYQMGQSEEWVGEWMKARDNRDEIILATKYTALNYKNGAADTLHIKSNSGGNSVKSMRVSLEASLKRLQTDYIDLFYVHMWDFTTTIAEVMHNLNDLAAAGKILYLGISDCPAWIVSQANQYARDHGLRQFSVYQGMWNAALRDFERDIIPMCRAEGMALAPYGVLGQGRFQTREGFVEREKHNPGRKFIPTSELDKKVSAVLESVAAAKGVLLLDVALAYVRSKAPYVFPIVGGRKVDHIRGSIKALEVALSEKEVEKIDAAYPFDHGFPHTFLSGTLFDGSTPRAPRGPEDVFMTKTMGTFDWVEQSRPIGLERKRT